MSILPAVRDFMAHDVPTLTPDAPVVEAVEFLLDKQVTGAPVVDKQGAIVGIITEYDCLKLLAEGANNQMPTGKVSDYMSKKVITVPAHMNIYFVAGMFLNAQVRRFPVVEDGKLIGAVTRYDILRAVKTNLD